MDKEYRKTMLEAIKARHSVRRYQYKPIEQDKVVLLQEKIKQLNDESHLHIQLVLNEPKGFSGFFAYGTFSGVSNYFIMAGEDDKTFDERVGYYGEQLVLYAQSIGLNTCWAGLSYRKVKGTYELNKGEKIACYIALGYGETQGSSHKIKSPGDVSNVSASTPDWFLAGVEAALLAPTAVNQQKFTFEYVPPVNAESRATVIGKAGFSIFGYTKMDLGIAKYHFEVGAGPENFTME